MILPELLSPAGSLKAMRVAFTYGADAIYAGLPRYSLRVRNNEFTLDNLAIGIAEAHNQNKRFYVVVNLLPHNAKINDLIKNIAPVVELNPDALIVSDPGVIHLLREAFPSVPLHLSVQANTMNWAAVKFWHALGISRIILSRELGLDEIAEIKQRCPEIELEVFVHGALCMAYSGRCLISNYMNKRDPNQGACTNACRWSYSVNEKPEASRSIFVASAGDPQAEYLLEEDEHGSYLFNSKDLRAVALVEKLVAIGVNSLKIEGRTKSAYYVGRTAQVYRRAIDDAGSGKPFDNNLLSELEGMANRGYTEGFLRRHQHQEMQNYTRNFSIGMQQVVGEVIDRSDSGQLIIDVKNKFQIGDKCLLMTPQGNIGFTLEHIYQLQGKSIDVAPGSGHIVCVSLPDSIPDHYLLNIEYAMLIAESF
ncbi:U32 family peptidase C-terminal domain-containing protein [Cellvibrio sp. QJXJ]|uniref:U32 family peptidase C-terminal domain-containing protein n=1 Tax=Cellvibrio sp. QJXJ TaxID=2964606 RepID=UPI0021C2634C|nr:U32 family peptidase C-terminal domain-containing protein [Cellvibrio sp. QJXJ]UUA75033.1 U32 family peptidase C-terminal domain-containing protein [Cellvibrio sp. QJXJ]